MSKPRMKNLTTHNKIHLSRRQFSVDTRITVVKPTLGMFAHNNRHNFSSNAFVFFCFLMPGFEDKREEEEPMRVERFLHKKMKN